MYVDLHGHDMANKTFLDDSPVMYFYTGRLYSYPFIRFATNIVLVQIKFITIRI